MLCCDDSSNWKVAIQARCGSKPHRHIQTRTFSNSSTNRSKFADMSCLVLDVYYGYEVILRFKTESQNEHTSIPTCKRRRKYAHAIFRFGIESQNGCVAILRCERESQKRNEEYTIRKRVETYVNCVWRCIILSLQTKVIVRSCRLHVRLLE
jgi:hypothetical protein